MDILKKAAVPFEIDGRSEDHRPLLVDPQPEHALVSWSTKEDMNNEFFPDQIVKALRLTRPAFRKKYRFIPTLESFHLANDRLYVQMTS